MTSVRPGVKQLKTSGGTAGWAHHKHILQDSAVDAAVERAKTDLLFKHYLEEQKRLDDERFNRNVEKKRPTIQDSTPSDIQHIKKQMTDEYVNKNNSSSNNNDDDGYDSVDDLERELGLGDEDEEEAMNVRRIHEARKQELKKAWKTKQQQFATGAGAYEEMSERDLLKLASKGNNCVIHFYADTVKLGKIVDQHLQRIAPKHSEARFVTLNSRMSPFLVSKWKIRTLPTICIIVNGYLVDKIIGFDEFGATEEFPTIAVVKRLVKSGVIKDPNTGKFKKQNLRTQVLTNLM